MKRVAVIVLGIVGLTVLTLVGVYVVRNLETWRYQQRAMAEVLVLAEAQRILEKDNGNIAKEFDDESWITPDVLYFKNGDWLVYRSRCSKEDWKVRDTFIAKGSDGKWYQSNYHFCIRLFALRMHGQSPDLPTFAERYSLKPLKSHP